MEHKRLYGSVLLALLVAPLQATATEPLSSAIVSGFSWAYFAKLAVALMTVLVFFLLFAWTLRRSQNGGRMQNNGLAVIASMSLGTRERLVVVQAGETQVLLGITPTNISSLTVLESPLALTQPQEEPSFRTTLERLLGKSAGRA